MKSTLRGVSAPDQDIYRQGLPPPPLYTHKVIYNKSYRNRVSFAAIAVFFCPHAPRLVAALRAVCVAFRMIWGSILSIDLLPFLSRLIHQHRTLPILN